MNELPMRPVLSARDERILAGEIELLERPVRPSVPVVAGDSQRPAFLESAVTEIRAVGAAICTAVAAMIIVYVVAQAMYAVLWSFA